MRIASYNILATTYIRPEWYPNIVPEHLDWAARKELLVKHLFDLNADVLCLQEVEGSAFDELFPVLKHRGYQGIFGRKGFGRIDGCATFFRSREFEFQGGNTVIFSDHGKSGRSSGHVALILKLEHNEQLFGIVNTHIRWNPPERALNVHRGYHQVKELINDYLTDKKVDHWILCGDFNAEEETPVIQLIEHAGFIDAYRELKSPTISKDGLARVDYIFHSPTLRSRPVAIDRITEETLMPSITQPSDHLAISADFN